jgi:hypothetical protein
MCGKRGFFVSLIVVFGFCAVAAQGVVVRAMGGGGYTLVDFEKASEYSDDYLEDWDQGNYSFALQGFWQVAPDIRIGGEAGWEQLYYYFYRIPYGYSPVYREASWSAMFVGGVVQIFLARSVYLTGGVDLHSFIDDGTALGVSGGIGAELRISERLALPLEVRVKPVFGAGTPTVLQVNAGLAFGAGR